MVLASVPAAEGVGWPDALPLLPHPAELIVGLIAFAILYWIYATKVVPKMEAMYEERAAAIEGGMQQAEEAQAEAKAALEKYNAQLAGARTEANEIRETAREQGASIVAEMRGQAQAEAARITESAKRQVDAERQQAVVSLRQEVGALSTTSPARSSASRSRTRCARTASSTGSWPSSRPATSSPRRSPPRVRTPDARLVTGFGQGGAGGVRRRARRRPRVGHASRRSCSRSPASSTAAPRCVGRWPTPPVRGPTRPGLARAAASAARSVRPPPAWSPSVAGQRWSAERDLADTLESLAVQACSRRPSASAASTGSRTSCSASSGSSPATPGCATPSPAATPTAPARPTLVHGLLEGKAAPETVRLVEQAVRVPRGRRLDRVLEAYLHLASQRRDELVALVTVAAPLTEQQQRPAEQRARGRTTASRSPSSSSRTPRSWAASASRSATRSSTAPSCAASTRPAGTSPAADRHPAAPATTHRTSHAPPTTDFGPSGGR